jgi:hypothetical protein
VTNPSKDKGTRAETAVLRYAQANGYPDAYRPALAGADLGDVHLVPGRLIAQVKAGKQAQAASLRDIDRWLADTDTQRREASATIGILIVQRRGLGLTRVELWDCHLDIGWLVDARATSITGCIPLGVALDHLRGVADAHL